MKKHVEQLHGISIRYKVMIWVMVILVMVGISVGVSLLTLNVMIRDYENLSVDNYKCYEVQKAIDAERNVFMDLIRDPSARNRERFSKACAKTRQCIDALPVQYSDIGEDRFARTWSLKTGYTGYTEYRDALLAMDPEDAAYVTEQYRVIEMQDHLSEYSLRLIQEKKVAVVPGEAFGESGRGFVRCSYASSLEELELALTRMDRFLNG